MQTNCHYIESNPVIILYKISRFLNGFCQTREKKGTMMTSFYHKYKDDILFNKNLLISGIISFLVGALFTQVFAQYDENHIVNSLITLVIGYAVYIPLFAFLFYRDKK